MEMIEHNAAATVNCDVGADVSKNRISLYKKHADDELLHILAGMFVNNSANRHIEIANAIKDGDIAHAHRLAHNLKSNAAQLRQSGLQKAAGEIEDNLENGENHVTKKQMQALERELAAVIKELSTYL